MSGALVHRGRYVTLREYEDRLEICLEAEDRKSFKEDIASVRDEKGIAAAEQEMFEDFLGNGWEYGDVSDLGALSEAPFLSREIERDDDGNIKRVGRFFYHDRYQIDDSIEELEEAGRVIWKLHVERA